MKKRFQKRSMGKIVFTLFGMLLLLTNCQDEEIPLSEIESSVEQEILAPTIEEAKLNFEQESLNGNKYVQGKNAKSNHKNFFAYWKKSKEVIFNAHKNSRMLLTPIFTQDFNPKIKSYIGSIKGKKSKVKSRIITLVYADESNGNAFTGLLIEKDLDEAIQIGYYYREGLLESSFQLSQIASKSTLARKDDCGGLTTEDLIDLINWLHEMGGGYFEMLPCVTITGYSGADEYEVLPEFSAGPTLGAPIPIVDQGSMNTTPIGNTANSSMPEPQTTIEWWSQSEAHAISSEVSSIAISLLPNLTSAQKSFIQDPVNYPATLQILSFLQRNSYSNAAQAYAMNAIDNAINGHEINLMDVDLDLEEECPDGYTMDKDGKCVEKPCSGNPVKNIEIAPQKGVSGTKGALFGCTRFGGDCIGEDGRTKSHDGIDIINAYGNPIYAMYDGFIYSTKYQAKGAGYYTRIQSTINGETILTEYFHLQNENRILQNQPGQPLVQVKAGDIIGYQGDSGNLKGALKAKTVDSHVHIEVKVHNGSSSWSYSSFTPVDPTDYFNTKIDKNGITLDNNCN